MAVVLKNQEEYSIIELMKKNVCKICRRQGQKLMLKGEKCFSPKCPFIRKPYPPGLRSKRGRRSSFSEYAKELKEKQKLKNFYGLSERQFSKYVKTVLQERGKVEDTTLLLTQKLESRLDNVIFRMGFAQSRKEARKLVCHSHFLVNNKPVNIPSFNVTKGMVISLKPSKQQKTFFKNIAVLLKNSQPPTWLKVNVAKMQAEVKDEPRTDDIGSVVDIPAIFEFYSR